ncbi:hypothetical protein RN001_008078 [Aquatica leii]|uniref:Uncharacterized protein n=1 Tax=Aquatica leii TaxID=1421715 RepID=A0AAN7SGD8_9COLE|nr:hypothetical protein RN001_008078 [Aquatica leii]
MQKIKLLLLLVLTSCSIADLDPVIFQHWLDVMVEFENTCACATGVDIAIQAKYMYSIYYPYNACLHCFVKCLYVSANFVNPDGSFKLKEFIRVFPETKDFAEKCLNESKNELDLCLKLYNIEKCNVRELGGFS